jgi:hypothetical protein
MCRNPDRMNPRNASSSQMAGARAINAKMCQTLGADAMIRSR